MNCPQCQTMNDSTSAFCSNCGTPLKEPGPQNPFVSTATPPAYAPAMLGAPDAPVAPERRDIPDDPYARRTSTPSTTFRLDLRRLSRVDQTVGGASVLVFISLFLPWFGVSVLGASFNISGTTAHGYLVIVAILALVLVGYMLLRSGWDEFPLHLPIAHAPLLLIGTGLQFILVLIGFFDKPAAGLNWEFGAYLAVIAAAVAAAPVVIPAIRSWQGNR